MTTNADIPTKHCKWIVVVFGGSSDSTIPIWHYCKTYRNINKSTDFCDVSLLLWFTSFAHSMRVSVFACFISSGNAIYDRKSTRDFLISCRTHHKSQLFYAVFGFWGFSIKLPASNIVSFPSSENVSISPHNILPCASLHAWVYMHWHCLQFWLRIFWVAFECWLTCLLFGVCVFARVNEWNAYQWRCISRAHT